MVRVAVLENFAEENAVFWDDSKVVKSDSNKAIVNFEKNL